MIKKRLVLFTIALCAMFSMNAQKRVTDNVTPTVEQQAATEKETSEKEWQTYGGVSFNWGFIEKGGIYNVALMFKGFVLEYGDVSQKWKDVGMDVTGWRLQAGYNYRYWFGDRFYAQGMATIGYGHSTVKYKGSSDKNSSGGGILSLMPGVGVRVWRSLSIQAGYRFDFSDFKFDKDHMGDYFTLGIQFGF